MDCSTKYIKRYTKRILQKYIESISKHMYIHTQIHPQMSKMYEMSKIYTKYRAAAGPAQDRPDRARDRARDRAAPGLGRAGPAAAWYFTFISYILDIFGLYMFCRLQLVTVGCSGSLLNNVNHILLRRLNNYL